MVATVFMRYAKFSSSA